MGSTRLPGKVLADIAGKPMIGRVLDRVDRIPEIAETVVAIPDLEDDDELDHAIRGLGHRVVRGSAADVLDRYRLAAERTSAEAVMRITADCPLLSPTICSRVVGVFEQDDVDYASNTLERTFPRGLDTEVVRGDALEVAAREATAASEREHVTPFVWSRPDRFRLRSVTGVPNRATLRWTVDTPADLEFVRAVYGELGDESFESDAVIALLDRRPEIGQINAGVEQKPIR